MIKSIIALASLIAGFAGLMSSSVHAQITIASNGKSDFRIVMPAQAPASILEAARELQKDIKLATGAELPIEKDDVKSSGPYISLGTTLLARAAGLDAQGLPQGAYRIVTQSGNLYIFGPDTPDGAVTPDTGTANGVYSFLEDELDVRWLMPGDIGRDVPARATFSLGEIDKSYTPPFTWRQLTHLWDFADEKQVKEIMRWMAHHRGADNPSFDYDHNWWRAINGGKTYEGNVEAAIKSPAVQQLYRDHPDWFAMDSNGNRPYPPNTYAKLETTNPELVKYFAELAIKDLKANPKKQYFSLSPSDGRGWSKSPASLALYDPPLNVHADIAMGDGNHPGVSSLILKWYHDVASIVAREYPQGKLSGYIYADYVAPPTKYTAKLPDNFTPMICGIGTYGYGLYRQDNREVFTSVMDSWGKIAPKTWYYYDLPNQVLRQHDDELGSAYYYEGNFPGSTGIVTPAAPEILNVLFSTLTRNHITGTYIYGVPSWSNAALANYLLAKLQWDPTLDAVKLQREWLVRAYGPKAGAVMETFYNQLDQWMGDFCRTNPGNCQLLTVAMLRDIYAAHYQQMESTYLQAVEQEMTDVQKQRLQFIGDNLIVLQWRLRNMDFWPSGLPSKLQRTNEQVVALLTSDTDAFAMFPGVVPEGYYDHPHPPQWQVRLDLTPATSPSTAVSGMDPNMYLIYAPAETTVRIIPTRISHGAYFASYLVRNAQGKTITWGVMDKGTPIEWKASANTPYYLYIPPRKLVDYDLTVENASVAQGALNGQTLTLAGPSAAVYVFNVPQDAPIGLFARGNQVNIVKPFSGAAAKAYLAQGDYYVDIEVLASMDNGWKFQPDPDNNLITKGVTKPDFNDDNWKTVNALDWWQMQGFPDYHGVAWYRIHFNLDQAPPPNGRRARLYFGAVDGNMVVYLNGNKAFEHNLGPAPDYKKWNVPSSFDVTWEIKKGENTLAIKVTSKNDTSASGIFKGVSLMTMRRADEKK